MATTDTKKRQPGGRVGPSSSSASADAMGAGDSFLDDRGGAEPQNRVAAGSAGSDRRPSDGGMTGELREAVRERASEQIETQRDRAANALGALAGAARTATQGLRDSGQPQLADYLDRASDGIERWSSRLREQNLDDTMQDVQAFARRNPAVFLGAALGAGILAARFFRSSRPPVARTQQGLWNAPPSRPQHDIANRRQGSTPAETV
jgi:hypothetical protein